jgi:cytochrome P450
MTSRTVSSPIVVGDRWADLTDPDVYLAGVPHATFQRLRDEDPISWWEERDGSGFWSVTRYQDIVDINRDFKTFTSRQGIRLEEMDPEELTARTTMMEMDPPEHTRLRRLVQGGFTRRMVASYEEAIRVLAQAVLEEALPRRRFDFVTDVARQLPMRMLGRLLGAPEQDYGFLVDRGDAMIGNSDPEFTQHVVDLEDTEEFRLLPFRSPAATELFHYAQRLADDRRANPREGDVVTKLLGTTVDGEPLSDLEFKNFFALMVAAGNDTTRYSIAGGLLALLDHPEQLALLQERPELLPTAIEEMLRWTSVTMHFRRTAVRDVEVHGKQIRAGDKVVLWWIAGDHDERQFPDPYRFDITRDPNEHLAFGRGGPHRCIGEWLARLEMKVTFEELLPRLGDIRLTGPVDRLRSNFISGIKHLPVEVGPA